MQSSLLSILESLITSKYWVRDSFNFATEIIDQDFISFMVSLKNFLLTSPLKKYWNLQKMELNISLTLATEELCFMFIYTFYKQITCIKLGLTIRCSLNSALANVFLAYHEQDWLDIYP